MAGPGGLEPPISRLEGGRSSSELQARSPQAAPCARVSSPRTARPRGAIASRSTRVKRAVIRKTCFYLAWTSSRGHAGHTSRDARRPAGEPRVHLSPGRGQSSVRARDTHCLLRRRQCSPALDTLLPLRDSNGRRMRDGPLSFVGAPGLTRCSASLPLRPGRGDLRRPGPETPKAAWGLSRGGLRDFRLEKTRDLPPTGYPPDPRADGRRDRRRG